MIRVLIVDDHPVVRAGLANLLRVEHDIGPVETIRAAAAAPDAVRRFRPDVVLVDYRLSDGDGLTLCRELEQLDVQTRVLVFSGYASEELAVAAAVAGAAGVLSKGAPGDLLFAAVRAVAADRGLGTRPAPGLVSRAAELLDPDDLPVFGLRLEGCSSAETAATLGRALEQVQSSIDRIVDTVRPRYWAADQRDVGEPKAAQNDDPPLE